MKDRYKFRIWDRKEKKMHYDDFVITATGYAAKLMQKSDDNKTLYFNQDDLELDKNAVVLQCTGMKDKNGQLIYDGDVLELDCDKRAEVFWNCTGFAIEVHYEDTKDTVVADAYELKNYTVEILGNVYENGGFWEE